MGTMLDSSSLLWWNSPAIGILNDCVHLRIPSLETGWKMRMSHDRKDAAEYKDGYSTP